MNKYNSLITAIYVLSAVLILRIFVFSANPDQHDKTFEDGFRDDYKIYAISHPDNLDFAGEDVPLENFDIMERFDRELLVNTYWQSQTLLFFKRANKWFPVIEPILENNEIPNDFK